MALDMNRIKVKMCMTVNFSSQTWVFLDVLFVVCLGFFLMFSTIINPWKSLPYWHNGVQGFTCHYCSFKVQP